MDALTEDIPRLITVVMQANDLLYGRNPGEYEAVIEFGEYGSPTFEQTVKTVGEASQSNLMSTETKVDALWGDRKDEDWKAEEVKRLKAEQGIADVEEPGIRQEAGGFMIGGEKFESENRTQNIPNVPEGVPGTAGGGEGTGANGDIRPGNK